MLDAGVRLLQKPFNLRDLKDRVREVLDSSPIPREVAMSVHTTHAAHTAPHGREQFPPSRAQRFQLHLPLKYRQLGEKDWHEGKTTNISRSGMLFQAEQMLQPNAVLEINLVLPAEIAGLSPTEVVCRGEIVRTVNHSSRTGGEDSAVSLPTRDAFAARVKSDRCKPHRQ